MCYARGMKINTHPSISPTLVGHPLHLAPGQATVELVATREMAADPQGLVHGGFVFGAADYAAMLAVNDPNVVLGSADVRFTAPVRVGQRVRIHAEVAEQSGKKHAVCIDTKETAVFW